MLAEVKTKDFDRVKIKQFRRTEKIIKDINYRSQFEQ
jgi:hypothetical protein